MAHSHGILNSSMFSDANDIRLQAIDSRCVLQVRCHMQTYELHWFNLDITLTQRIKAKQYLLFSCPLKSILGWIVHIQNAKLQGKYSSNYNTSGIQRTLTAQHRWCDTIAVRAATMWKCKQWRVKWLFCFVSTAWNRFDLMKDKSRIQTRSDEAIWWQTKFVYNSINWIRIHITCHLCIGVLSNHQCKQCVLGTEAEQNEIHRQNQQFPWNPFRTRIECSRMSLINTTTCWYRATWLFTLPLLYYFSTFDDFLSKTARKQPFEHI